MAISPKRVCNGLFHILSLLLAWYLQTSSAALGTFGFDIHHRYSDTVKNILKIDHGMPEKNTPEYYTAMVHHDRRRLAEKVDSARGLTFAGGNQTVRIDELAFLHYAEIWLGTPKISFLMALDTGSDLAWIPCDCTNCARSFVTRRGKRLDFNIYSPNTSTTSTIIPCSSSKCVSGLCVKGSNDCYYQIKYLDGSSSTGMMVEDILHLVTNDEQQNIVHASIILGCGMSQSGGFLSGGGINGILGLGTDNLSVPSILASKGLTADSFSMCFGKDGVGRIVFGDKGSSTQGETPFFVHELIPTYTVTMTQIIVGGAATNLLFTAIVDSGTSFTYLEDSAYATVTSKFNAQVQDLRYRNISSIAFEYCYNLRANSFGPETPDVPKLSFTTKGGNHFNITMPIAIFSNQERDGYIYCLTLIKGVNISIIGQNFMTGHRIVFDRERMLLGWRESDCYDADNSNSRSPTKPPPPFQTSPTPINRENPSSPLPPAPLFNRQNFPEDNFPRSTSNGVQLNPFVFEFIIPMVLFSLFNHYSAILSS